MKTEKEQKEILENISKIGTFYQKEFLKEKINKRDNLKKDFWEADIEFIRNLFYRGRRDELSFRYEKTGLYLLDNYFGKNDKERKRNFATFNKIKNDIEESLHTKINTDDPYYDFDNFRKEYQQQFSKKLKHRIDLHLTNKEDIKMIISALEFISKECKTTNYNIYVYALDNIKNHKTMKLYEKLKTIHQVGQKLASFFIRDLIIVYELKKYLTDEDFKAVFPIDTWVRQVAIKIEICNENDNDKIIIEKLVETFKKHKINELLFNAGAWYLGSRPFYIFFNHGLINYLNKIT